ncbi:MAK10-like protein [Tanacetum coccineum]
MRLRLFQLSLRDQASNWLECLPVGSISTWEDLTTYFLAQFFPPGRTAKLQNDILMFQQHHVQIFYDHVNLATRQTNDQLAGGKLRDKNAEESWVLLEDLALYDNESWNDPRDFTKPVMAISLPQDVPSTSDHRLIDVENQVQRLMEALLAPKLPNQSQTVIKIETQQTEEPEQTLEDEFKDLHLNLPVLEVLAHAPMYNAILDKYMESLELGKNRSAFIQGKMPER